MNEFTKCLVDIVGVMHPSPSAEKLTEIAARIVVLPNAQVSRGKIAQIVNDVCPNTRFLILEGVDNSPLNTILMLAIKAAAEKLAKRA